MKIALVILGLTLALTTASFGSFPEIRMRTVQQACTLSCGQPAYRTICLDDGSDHCAFKDCGQWDYEEPICP